MNAEYTSPCLADEAGTRTFSRCAMNSDMLAPRRNFNPAQPKESHSMSKHEKVSVLLVALKEVLEQHGHWRQEMPADEALASAEPFAVDTLSCTEWLQWIFIPKMAFLLEHQQPLPVSFSISPYVEEATRGLAGHADITRVSMDIDALFTPQ